MIFQYAVSAYDDLKSIDALQVHMLLDYFESHYHQANSLDDKGRVLTTGEWRILFVEEEKTATVLRVLR